MGKHLDALQKQLTEARNAQAQAEQEHAQVKAAYDKAVNAGHMDKAREQRTELDRLAGVIEVQQDRIKALESQREAAESKDAAPLYEQAMKDAEAALSEEYELHQQLADAVDKLVDLRRRATTIHSETQSAIMRAHRVADAAHKPRPEFKHRSRLQAYPQISAMFQTARELGNVADNQAQQLHTAREQARKAA